MKGKKPPGKWIEGLDADAPVVETARRVLRIRLEAVEMMLPLAAHRAAEDVEHIHQLRVATRRADAAVRLFGACLPEKQIGKLHRKLRRIRRAAGRARECDVQGPLLVRRRDGAEGTDRLVLDELIAWTKDERRDAQRKVRRVARRCPRKKLERRRRRVIDALREPAGVTPSAAPKKGTARASFKDLAQYTLPPLAAQLAEGAAADLSVLENLHELRIRGKRVRYAAEVFAPRLGPKFRELYASVQSLQERLGDVNDSHELMHRVEAFIAARTDPEAKAAPPGAAWLAAAEALRDACRRERDEAAARFLVDWNAGNWSVLATLDSHVRGNGNTDPDREAAPVEHGRELPARVVPAGPEDPGDAGRADLPAALPAARASDEPGEVRR